MISPKCGSKTNWKAIPTAAPEMTNGAKMVDRTKFRPLSARSSNSASASPITMLPTTANSVKITVFETIVQVSERVAHSR